MTISPVHCRSMTGYANIQRPIHGYRLNVELRSVNNRFLDLTFRLGDELRAAEPALRESIVAAVARGKVECRISIQRERASAVGDLDLQVVRQLNSWQAQIQSECPAAVPLSVADILGWPHAMRDAELASEQLFGELQQTLQACLQDFIASREREGAALAKHLIDRAARIEAFVQQLRERLPQLQASWQSKLTHRLHDLLDNAARRSSSSLGRSESASEQDGQSGLAADELKTRLGQEIALLGLRADVDEELTRLDAHLREIRRVLSAGHYPSGIGKRLDFLIQELHREANTLGSKAAGLEITEIAIEIKLLIEQMREQVQNIE